MSNGLWNEPQDPKYDYYKPAVMVAEIFFEDPPMIGVARGDEFADALTGGAHATLLGGRSPRTWPTACWPRSRVRPAPPKHT